MTSDYGGTGTSVRPLPYVLSITETFTTYTSLHTLIFGPKLELRFPRRISIEVDALHRPRERGYTVTFSSPVSIGSELVSSVTWKVAGSTWEMPFLLKYRLPISEKTPFGSPFVEAGASLRPWLYGREEARAGLTAGAGLRLHLRNLEVEPTIRYTRWGAAKLTSMRAKADQVELLVGVGAGSSSLRPSIFGQKLSIGIVGGLGLTGDFPAKDGYSSARSNLVGLLLESAVSKRLSVEFDALYRPRVLSEGQRATVLTWEFPILAKYKFSTPLIKPFLELGPSFRSSGNTNGTNPSHFGISAGAGIEATVHKLRVAPALRYTYWAADDQGPMSPGSTIRNQVGFVVGFLF